MAFSHPFALPAKPEEFLAATSHRELLALEGEAMDLVLDGEEIGSGSSLIYDVDMQMNCLVTMG